MLRASLGAAYSPSQYCFAAHDVDVGVKIANGPRDRAGFGVTDFIKA